jgi:mercuric ion binding protein
MRWISALIALAALAAMPALAGAPQTVVLDLKNMTCGLCPITVEKSLQKVRGVAEAKANLDTKTATVTFDPDRTTPAALIRATTDAGYPSTVHK